MSFELKGKMQCLDCDLPIKRQRKFPLQTGVSLRSHLVVYTADMQATGCSHPAFGGVTSQ